MEPLTQAEDEAGKLLEYFLPGVIHLEPLPTESALLTDGKTGYFDELQRDCHSILFARSGEGKTASRLVLTQELKRRGIVVRYLDFDSSHRLIEEHADKIYTLLTSAQTVRKRGLALHQPLQALESLCQEQVNLGQQVFVLVDNVERMLGPRAHLDAVEKALENLFDPTILQIPGLYFKFFLPASLKDRLFTSYQVFRSGTPHFNFLHIHWNEAYLCNLLGTRIEQVQVSELQTPTLESISADMHGQPFDLDGAMVKTILGHPGAPRNLLRLANEVIYVHARNESDRDKFRLTYLDLSEAVQKRGLQSPGTLQLVDRAPKEKKEMKKEVDFVIVTALEEECDAVLSKLPEPRKLTPSTSDTRVYYEVDLPTIFPDGSTGAYHIIVMLLLGMGRVHAAAAASDAIHQWHPRYIVLIGIAGGIAARSIHIGDILVSDQIVDYELQKLTPDGPQVRWEVQRADARLLNACKNFRSTSWQGLIKVKRPGRGKSSRHIGPIASGDKVIAFGDILAKYQDVWPKLLGVEMEAAGVATAAFQAAKPPGFFMVRGVSDLADEAKGTPDVEKWRSYACDVAASYAIALLKSGPVPL